MAPSAKMSLIAAPNGLGDAEIGELRKQILAAADRFSALIAKRGYRAPFASDETSTSGARTRAVMNAAIVLGAAYDLTKDAKYANGVIDCIGLHPRPQPAGHQLRHRLRHASR